MPIQAASCVHIGGRAHQEDGAVRSITRNGTRALLAAIDGMGGPGGGDHAMRMVRKHLMRIGHRQPSATMLRQAIKDADAELYANSRTKGIMRHNEMPGCVLTAIWLDTVSSRVCIGHIGDTRAFQSRPSQPLVRLTTDHTWVQENLPQLRERERMMHRMNHIVIKNVGTNTDSPDMSAGALDANQAFLICSDGLHDVVHSDILDFVMQGLWQPRAYIHVASMFDYVRQLNRDLGIANPPLDMQIVEILLRAREGNRTPAQVVDDLGALSLAYQHAGMKQDNITALVGKITP